MSSAFYIYSDHATPFSLNDISAQLANFTNVCQDPNDSQGFVVAASQSECTAIAKALKADPRTPQWVVFLHVEPDVIQVHREATADTLRAFKPILENLLNNSNIESVKDEEGRIIVARPNDQLVSRLLE
jgi:hypothetical protein